MRLEGSKDDSPIPKNSSDPSTSYGETDLRFVFGPSPPRSKSDDTRVVVTNEKRGQQQRVRKRINREDVEKEMMPSPPIDSHYRQYPVAKYPYHYNTASNQMSHWGASAMGAPSFPTPSRGPEQFMIGENRRVNPHDTGKENELPSSKQPRNSSGSDWSPLFKEKKESDISGDDKKEMKKKVLIRSPPIKKRRVVESWNDHDQKEHEVLDADLVTSSPFGVFRSPCADKIKRRVGSEVKGSPLFDQSAEYLSHSFSLETPGKSKLDDMFPSSHSFDLANDPTPFPMSDMDEKRERNSDENEKITSKQDPKEQGSPFSLFGELSPLRHPMQSPQESKLRASNDQQNGVLPFEGFGSPGSSPLPLHNKKMLPRRNAAIVQLPKLPPTNVTGKRSAPLASFDSRRIMKPSPPQHVHVGGMRYRGSPLSGPFPSPGPPFSFQIGNMGGMKQTEARKGMEGINTALKAGSHSMKHPSVTPHSTAPGRQHQQGPSQNIRHMHQTPNKMNLRVVSTPSVGSYHMSTPGHGGFLVPGTINRYQAQLHRSAVTPAKTPSHESIKLNVSPSLTQRRRNPCNCKKSKCLKLYCECFAAEVFCDGCNCVDCNNIPEKDAIRSKAIADTKAKNPHAFKPRFSTKNSRGNPGTIAPVSKGHNMGCRCKKSACLKKYCECFEAGVTCSEKCKCLDCQNFVGSQALIDRRRKIKDHKGAEIAMRTADEHWKGYHIDPNHVQSRHQGLPGLPPVFPSPAQHNPHGMRMHPMMSPQHFVGRPQMIMGPMGYSPIGMPPMPPPYHSNDHLRRSPTHQFQTSPNGHKAQILAPKNPAARRGFDPHSSKKKKDRKAEPPVPYFGYKNTSQTKTTALAIFSFLSNDDIYNASLVSKAWSKLSLDEELWQFD